MDMWRSGNKITAEGLNRMLPLTAWKSTTTSRASTTTTSDDPDLVIEIPDDALINYAIEVFIVCNGPALGTGDIKIEMTYSGTTASAVWMASGITTSSATDVHTRGSSFASTQSFGVNGATFSTLDINGLIDPTTAGTVAFKWAQNTSNATPTNVRLGSWMRLIPLEAPTP